MRVSVCIATYRRPELLECLLTGLRHQQVGSEITFDIVVVDNDLVKSASSIVENAQRDGLSVSYFSQPVKSIAITRNVALDNAHGDVVGFLDDDEQVAPDWLTSMIGCMEDQRADCVFGPVDGIVPDDAPAWIRHGRFFDRPTMASGTVVPYGGTGNVLMRAECIAGGHRFDSRFGRTGGEDTDFFYRLHCGGAKLVWCNEARAVEHVPKERLKLRWLLRRAFRGGQTYADIVARPADVLHRGFWLIERLGYAVLATILVMAFAPFNRAHAAKWMLKVASNLGQLTTVASYRFEEY